MARVALVTGGTRGIGAAISKALKAASQMAFTAAAVPGAYLRVLDAGPVRAGDLVEVVHRPAHDVTIGVVFRAMTKEPELLPRLVGIAALPDEIRQIARARV